MKCFMVVAAIGNHGVQKKRPGGKIDNGRAGNAERTNLTAAEDLS